MKPDVQELFEFDGEDLLWLYCKGHVSDAEFIEACQWYEKDILVEAADIERGYMRKTPARDQYGRTTRMDFCEKGPGAFAVTWIESWDYSLTPIKSGE